MTQRDEKDGGVRCGDHVYHRPTGEDWLVAYVDGNYLAPCGWPPGEAKVADCTVVYRCTDEEHVSLLEDCAKLTDKRGDKARALLAERDK